MRWIFCFWMNLCVFSLYPALAFTGDLPAAGSKLPDFQIISQVSDQERAYLGIGETKPFSIDRIQYKLLVLEIVGVYCPQCHIQYPLFNKLYYRIKKDRMLHEKAKFLAIAIGATPMEVAFLKKQSRIPYPVVNDPKFEIHKQMGEPRTPFTLLVARGGNILFSHLGPIEDIDKFYLRIRRQVQE